MSLTSFFFIVFFYRVSPVNINLLHLSSRKAVEAALMMQTTFPHINFRREVTVGLVTVG
ncbi:hypothetical protein [Dapis sp. BLCC M229]|uniref:hypothetical protein n=1 Tax=Dapis sp. BLCC M229 TaxID=3400188 RepID=UPI003CF5C5BA